MHDELKASLFTEVSAEAKKAESVRFGLCHLSENQNEDYWPSQLTLLFQSTNEP